MIVLPKTLIKSAQNSGASPAILSQPSSLPKLRHFWYAVENNGVRNIGPQKTSVRGTFSSGVVWSQSSGFSWMRFNSSGTRVVTAGDSGGTGGPLNNVFTIMARVNLTDVANYQTFYGSAESSTVIVFRINTSSQLELVKPAVAVMANSTGTLSANKTYTIAVTYDGATVRFYIDGKDAGSGSFSATFNHNVQYYIGAEESTGATRPFQDGGKIGYVAVWDKAMSVSEVNFYSKNIESLFAQSPNILANSVAAAATTYAKTQAFVSC